jgi:transposase-like protein
LVVETWEVFVPIYLLCTVVTEEGHPNSKRMSYTAKFKREVIRFAEENEHRKAAAIFGDDVNNVRLWRKHTAAGQRG